MSSQCIHLDLICLIIALNPLDTLPGTRHSMLVATHNGSEAFNENFHSGLSSSCAMSQ